MVTKEPTCFTVIKCSHLNVLWLQKEIPETSSSLTLKNTDQWIKVKGTKGTQKQSCPAVLILLAGLTVSHLKLTLSEEARILQSPPSPLFRLKTHSAHFSTFHFLTTQHIARWTPQLISKECNYEIKLLSGTCMYVYMYAFIHWSRSLKKYCYHVFSVLWETSILSKTVWLVLNSNGNRTHLVQCCWAHGDSLV